MDKMKILLIGGGGREHALAHAINRSPRCGGIIAAPGNPGIAEYAECIGALDIKNHKAVIEFTRANNMGLIIIGPENPLVDGLVDSLAAANIPAFGPSAKAALLEGSKSFARDFCRRHHIPQPDFARFDDAKEAIEYINAHESQTCVIKADGLAAGKGVVVADNKEEAIAAVNMMLCDKSFGDASSTIVIEERITGTEASLFALCDGEGAVCMGSAQDYKRAHDDNTGPNTGGMGAVSPAPALTADLQKRAWEEIVLPVMRGMKQEGAPYRGFLYCGLMLTATGPQVIEFNCRFGDPEAQTILPRLQSDLLELMAASLGACGIDENNPPAFDSRHAVTVIMANRGYPGDYEKGAVISGLDKKTASDSHFVFHAGTTRNNNGAITATGGRVLAVTALGVDKNSARNAAYEKTASITWENCFYRRDIAED